MSLDARTIQGETFVVNMGPQHPATHGVLRLKLTMDGEYIMNAEPVIGYSHRMQEKMAETLSALPTQLAYNRIKGSVPVRRDLGASALAALGAPSSCARDSWETFASPTSARVPSLAHRMAADEATKDAVAQALWRYLSDPRMDAREAQKRLASVIRTP